MGIKYQDMDTVEKLLLFIGIKKDDITIVKGSIMSAWGSCTLFNPETFEEMWYACAPVRKRLDENGVAQTLAVIRDNLFVFSALTIAKHYIGYGLGDVVLDAGLKLLGMQRPTGLIGLAADWFIISPFILSIDGRLFHKAKEFCFQSGYVRCLATSALPSMLFKANQINPDLTFIVAAINIIFPLRDKLSEIYQESIDCQKLLHGQYLLDGRIDDRERRPYSWVKNEEIKLLEWRTI